MSFNIEAAKRRSALLLATSILALNGSLASAQTPPTALPPVEVSAPTDPNKTRARPLDNDGSGTTTRPARTARPSRGAGTGLPMAQARVRLTPAAQAAACDSSTALSALRRL